MPVTASWSDFIAEYSSDSAYWYVPQGGTPDTDEFREKFRVFDLFEGELWTPDVQAQIVSEWRDAGLSKAGDDLTRQIKRVFENMGLCWIADYRPIRVTPAGRAFLREESGRSITLDHQVWLYQLPNPVNASAATAGIRLHPHAFLVEAILECAGYLTRREYVLFVSRARSDAELAKSIERITSWRTLTTVAQDEIVALLSKTKYSTINHNDSYAMAFHHCDLLLDKENGGLSVADSNLAKLRRRLSEHKGVSEIITFRSEPDCISFYGDTEHKGTQLDALDYYVDVSDVENAVKVFKKLSKDVRGEMTPEEFERSQFLEKDLENYLRAHLNKIESGLELIGSQHPTTVGPIDIFAKAKNGDLVVIELKKGRAADKVFGQICRYMGCIKSEQLASGPAVRGYIVGREVDIKLRYAAKVVPAGTIQLQSFELNGEEHAEDWIQVSAA